jgi:hypothetical protein
MGICLSLFPACNNSIKGKKTGGFRMLHRVRIIENMKAIMAKVTDLDWRQKAHSFIKRLEDILVALSDADFFALCKQWEEELLTPVLHQIYQAH